MTDEALTPELIILGSTLFDGQAVLHDGIECGVAVRDGVILATGVADALKSRFPNAEIHSYPGTTVTPGLIDAHVHLTMPGDGTQYEPAVGRNIVDRLRTAFVNLRSHLENGVTTVRDLGSHLDFLAWQPADQLVVPRLIRYGPPITAAGGHMHHFGGAVTTAEEASAMVLRNLRAGADGIKIVASGGTTIGSVPPHEVALEEQVLRAATNSAHDHGRVITAHSLSTESVLRAARAGTDGIEHLAFLTPSNESKFDPQVADIAIAAEIAFGSTIGCNNRYTSRAARGDLDPFELEEQQEKTAYYVKNAALMRERGARIIVASDSGWKHTHFGDITNEMALLQEAGYSAVEVLAMATGLSARALHIDDVVGELNSGLCADVAVFNGRPTERVSDTHRVAAVYREGVRVFGNFVEKEFKSSSEPVSMMRQMG